MLFIITTCFLLENYSIHAMHEQTLKEFLNTTTLTERRAIAAKEKNTTTARNRMTQVVVKAFEDLDDTKLIKDSDHFFVNRLLLTMLTATPTEEEKDSVERTIKKPITAAELTKLSEEMELKEALSKKAFISKSPKKEYLS